MIEDLTAYSCQDAQEDYVSYREPCCCATLLLMGIGFLRGTTFPKRDHVDHSLDWSQPYERTTPTKTDRSLSS